MTRNPLTPARRPALSSRWRRGLCAAALGLAGSLAQATCPPHAPTPPQKIRSQAGRLMIVVHATATHDARYATKRGVDEAVRYARRQKIPVIYLEDDTPGEFYFMEDCAPDHWAFSQGGEIRFPVDADHLYILGGHLELCLSATLHDILLQWARQPARDRRVTFLMDAIYSNGKLVDRTDPFWPDFVRFMDIVTYGRPGGEHWPKLTLLESMGIIVRQDHEVEYARQVLPRWDRTFPDSWRVELLFNGKLQTVLRAGDGWQAPALRFDFVDSALVYSWPQCNNGDSGLCQP